MRYLAPATDRVTSDIALYVKEDGQWKETDYVVLGNYLCFDVGAGDFELLAVERPADITRVVIICAAAVILVLIIVTAPSCATRSARRRRGRKAPQTE